MMVDNFSWEMDLSRDLRKGDKFMLSWDGEKTPCAMIYVGSRKTIALFSYKNSLDQKKYFTSKGATINDTFAFAPTKYNRISSGFTKRRFHPTLKIYRSHRGTDFAAPSGTPVYAPAKGIVKYKATLSGYGNVIYLKHGSNYLTVYAHLSKFAKGLKSGKRLKTAALHFKITDKNISDLVQMDITELSNSEKIKLPKQSFVPTSAMPEFQKRARKILQDLNIK